MATPSAPYADTDPRAREVWLSVLRAKTPGERIAMALHLTAFAIQIGEQSVRARYPSASDREVVLRAAALRLSPDLMRRAYGWDPNADANPG